MQRTRNIIIILVALAAIVLIAVIAGNKRHDALSVRMAKVAYGSFQTRLPESGTVMRPGTQTIPTLVAGNIDDLYVKAGDRVTSGELLATIENPTLESNAAGSEADYQSAVANVSDARINQNNARVQYEAAVATQRSAYNEAKRIYDADVELYAQKAIPKNTVDADKAKLDQARFAYDQAMQQLRLGAVTGYGVNSVKYAAAAVTKAKIVNDQNQQQLRFERITAPSAGIIQSVASQPSDALRPVQPGDAVTAGQTLFTVSAGDSYIVKAQVDEQDIINVRTGQRAEITGEDFPGKTLTGHVTRIAPIAIKSSDASSTAKQVLTTIALDRSPAFLKDGMTVDVDIITADVPHAIVVPNDAVTKSGGKSYVFVVHDGEASRRQIRVTRVGDTSTLVASGIRAGETVVVERNAAVVDGSNVTAAPSASPSPQS